jgi:heterokaryon incompatibility protein (HET)
MSGAFIYYTLTSPRHFRLFTVVDNNPAHLGIKLESFSIDHSPSFEALSYTWGSAVISADDSHNIGGPDNLYRIQCNDVPIDITENLYDALCELTRSCELGYLWVDAVCINQADTSERSAQVLLMGEIYGQAEKVIVWLGKDMTDLGDFKRIHDIIPPFKELVRSRIRQEKPQPGVLDPIVLSTLNIDKDQWVKYLKAHGRFYLRR